MCRFLNHELDWMHVIIFRVSLKLYRCLYFCVVQFQNWGRNCSKQVSISSTYITLHITVLVEIVKHALGKAAQ